MKSDDFESSWGFCSALKTELSADGYEVNLTQEKFKSGRPKYVAIFFKGRGPERQVITRRDAMELISKNSGKPYFVASKHEQKAPKPKRHVAPKSGPPKATSDDVFDNDFSD